MAAELGNEVRGVTRATRGAAGTAVGATGAFVTLVAYAVTKTGFETDAETAVLVAGAFVTAVGAVVAWVGATWAGKRTPSDPAQPVGPTQSELPDPTAIPEGPAAEAPVEELPPAAPGTGSTPVVGSDPSDR